MSSLTHEQAQERPKKDHPPIIDDNGQLIIGGLGAAIIPVRRFSSSNQGNKPQSPTENPDEQIPAPTTPPPIRKDLVKAALGQLAKNS